MYKEEMKSITYFSFNISFLLGSESSLTQTLAYDIKTDLHNRKISTQDLKERLQKSQEQEFRRLKSQICTVNHKTFPSVELHVVKFRTNIQT